MGTENRSNDAFNKVNYHRDNKVFVQNAVSFSLYMSDTNKYIPFYIIQPRLIILYKMKDKRGQLILSIKMINEINIMRYV